MNEGFKKVEQSSGKPATREELLQARTQTLLEINKLNDTIVGLPPEGPEIEIAILKMTRLQKKLNIVDGQLEKSNATTATIKKTDKDSGPDTIPNIWDDIQSGGSRRS